MNFLQKFDKFGTQFNLKLANNKDKYKSTFGGIVSIIIQFLSLIYFSYKINQFTSNSLNPIQSIAYEFTESLSMEIEGQLIEFSIFNTLINPFNSTNQILVPYMMKLWNNSMYQMEYFNSNRIYSNNEINFETKTYKPENLSLSVGNLVYPSNLVFAFSICNSSVHQNCANDSEINQFFAQKSLIIRTAITTYQYNSFSKEITPQIRNSDFVLDRSFLFFQRVIMQAQLLDIDEGFLLSTSDQKWIFNDYFIQTQSTGTQAASEIENIFVTEVSLSQVTQRKSVQFIKISAVLADVGSIFSSLMMIGIIVTYLNQTWMEEEIVNQVIGIYYPQFSQLKYERKFYIGPIKNVVFHEKSISLESFQRFYHKAFELAQAKLRVTSNIYSISRLQFGLQTLVTSEILSKMHQFGIQMNLVYEIQKSPRESQIIGSDNQTLKYEELQSNLPYTYKDSDFFLLDQKNDHLIETQSNWQLLKQQEKHSIDTNEKVKEI